MAAGARMRLRASPWAVRADAYLAGTGLGNVLLDQLEDLGTTVLLDDHALRPIAILGSHTDRVASVVVF
jgi:hypothetical protein